MFAKNITSNDLFRLLEGQPTQSSSFSNFEIFVLPVKIFCFSKALEASKVSPSEGITAEQKISKSVCSKDITSNDLFRLLEGQPTQSSSPFSFLTIFLSYMSKILCFSKALEASKVSSSEGITAEQKT